MADVEREYAYRPKWSLIAFCAAFFGLCAVVLGSKAANNDRGVIISRIIELDPDGATAFYWALTAGSGAFVAVAAFLAYHRLAYRQRLAFASATLIVPASRWSRFEKMIAYRDIRELSERSISGQRFLDIVHVGGKYTINAAMLSSQVAFEEVRRLLAAKVREAQSPEQRPAEPVAAPDPAT
jgi:hypothetical protein